MNKLEFMGRLTNDVEARYTTDNKMVASFSIAVNRSYVKQGEERKADFFNIVAFGKQAEFIQKYFSKGQMIALVGRLQNNNYVKEGKTVYQNQIIVEEVFFAGDSKKKEEPQFEPTQAFDDWDTMQNDDLPF